MAQVFHYTTVPSEPMPGHEGVSLRWVIGQNVQAPNFAMRVMDVQPGEATEHHAHGWEHEVFVLEGQGIVRDPQGGETPIGPGTCVYVAPNEVHQFLNRSDAVLRFICVIPNPRQS